MQFWTPNRQIDNGRFTIEKIIGGGGFCVTYRARENRTGKLVVIKTLNSIQQTKQDFDKLQISFVNEAMRLAKCNHPHIVKVYELIQENGLWGMVMEYIDGDDLAKYIEEQGKLREDEALNYIQQIGQALEYIHQQDLLHRDVKPQNIILRHQTKEAILIDFGLARQFTINKTGSMTNSKTEGYAPIEQYERRGNFAPYTDVYALAATLYSLLTAEIPLPANFRKQASLTLPPPKQHNLTISETINNAIIQGMALEPKDRPQTVREWLSLLTLLSISTPSLDITLTSAKPPEKGNLKTFTFPVITVNKYGQEIKREKKSAQYITIDLGKGITMDLVSIPAGEFIMGSPESEEGRNSDEGPQHRVKIPAFFMGKYEVTQEQYEAVMGQNPSYFKGAKLPVERVSWYDCVEFCKQLSQKLGKEYSLPSEAQWEYATRAGTTTPFHFGETITTDLVNFNENYTYASAAKGVYREKTTEVGSFPPNGFGLYDMHGNVWEWCADNWHDNYEGAPTDGSAWVKNNWINWIKNNSNTVVVRGGSWPYGSHYCRSADRINVYGGRTLVVNGIGFRVVSFAPGIL